MNPVRRWLSGLCLATSLAVHVSGLRAQIVNDGASQTLSSVTNFLPGNVTVGTNGSFTLLVLSDNATLTNSGFSTIGQNASAKSNEVRLVSPTSRWLMGASTANPLFVGSNGAANRLIVSNGATASVQASAYLGYISESASNNQVWVTGSNSVLSSAANIEVGFLGSGNQVIVSNGGTVLATNVILGDGTIASNNLALVTGAGSLWSSAVNFFIGDDGSGNRLVVSLGGAVRSGLSRIGGALLSGSGNNLALITGTGSVWSNALDLEIGRSLGINNRLVVSNGATVSIGGDALLGVNNGANSNSVFVTDPGSRWLLATNLYLGSNGSFNVLIVSNGASSAHGIVFFGFNASSSNNLAVITGTNSVLTNRSGLRIGQSGSGNRLVITNGGRMQSFVVLLGFNGSSGNNEATLTGPGSRWNASANVNVGNSGSGNRFFVRAGGQMRNTSANIGAVSGSSNNLAVVSDPSSSWTNIGPVRVGTSGSRNSLVVSNQGLVFTEGVIIGSEASSTNNRSVVDGGILLASDAGVGALDIRRGTNVLNSGLIDVDLLLMTNALGKFEFNGGTLVTRGALISNGADFIVGNPGGTPAVWDVRAGDHVTGDLLVIGNGASFNQLILTNGAFLTNGNCLLGNLPAANSNLALVSGNNSRWETGNGLEIGSGGSFNRLVVSNGGIVTCGYAEVGSHSPSNYAVVTDLGSLWHLRDSLEVGSDAGNSLLIVSNSATVFASNAVTVGFNATSTNNRVIIDGGTLRVTNAFGQGVLDVRRGTNVLNAGLVDVDRLFTSAQGRFEFNGGTLRVKQSSFNAESLRVGNGTSPATLVLVGNGGHGFGDLLSVSANAALIGNGTLGRSFTVEPGGLLSPGQSIGTISGSENAVLQGTTLMEISKTGAALTNDLVLLVHQHGQLTNGILYGGTLIVTNIGPDPLVAGNQFRLFDCPAYAGSFTTIQLPPLNPGLGWMNKLTLDGSIEVVSAQQPKFSTITVSGTNVILTGTDGIAGQNYAVLTATNVTTPLSNWVGLLTNQFGAGGSFSFTNPIAPGEFQRFFLIRTP